MSERERTWQNQRASQKRRQVSGTCGARHTCSGLRSGLGLGLGLGWQVSGTRSTCGVRHTWSGLGLGLGRAADLREGCSRHQRRCDAEGGAAGEEALGRHAQLTLAHPGGVHTTQHWRGWPLRLPLATAAPTCRRRLPLHGAARLSARQHGCGGGGGVPAPVDVRLRLLRVVEGRGVVSEELAVL